MHPNDDCDDEDNGEDRDKGEDEDQHCQFPHDLSSSFGSLRTRGVAAQPDGKSGVGKLEIHLFTWNLTFFFSGF